MKHLTPCQAIKKYCKVKCCNEDMLSWKLCTIKDCPLYPYRLGKRPKNNRQEGTFEAKESIPEG